MSLDLVVTARKCDATRDPVAKAKMQLAYPSPLLTIRDPEGVALDPQAQLHVNVKYTYELESGAVNVGCAPPLP